MQRCIANRLCAFFFKNRKDFENFADAGQHSDSFLAVKIIMENLVRNSLE